MFGNRLATLYGMKMIAYAIHKPFTFICGMAKGKKPLGASYYMQLNSNLPGPIPHRNRKQPTAGDLCQHICPWQFCTWYSSNLDFATDAMIADWKYLASPEVVPINDYDDAVIHLRFGDGLYSLLERTKERVCFLTAPTSTY